MNTNSTKINFIKMHGIGNDYVFIDCFKEKIDDPATLARLVSDRHFGIGSDGLILICPSDSSDIGMKMYNADGSQGDMCGNGARCVAMYSYVNGLVEKKQFTLETKSGQKAVTINTDGDSVESITIDMGVPRLTTDGLEDIEICEEKKRYIGVDVGNPHAIYFVESLELLSSMKLKGTGQYYEKHDRFADGVNSEFVWIEDRKNIWMRVWERGSGETLACGTGAVASAYACINLGYCDDDIKVHLAGGNLDIKYDRMTGHIFLTGPATISYTGRIDIDSLGALRGNECLVPKD